MGSLSRRARRSSLGARCAVALQLLDEYAHQHAVKLRAAELLQLLHGFRRRFSTGVWTISRHIDVSFGDGDDASAQGNLLSLKTVRISAAVKALLMMQHKSLGVLRARNSANDLRAHRSV